jgi:hypothetical protein
MLIDHTDDYFSPLEEEGLSEALRGYFYDSATTKRFRAYSNMQIDNACLELGNAINTSYSLIDMYSDIATQETISALTGTIEECEKVFSERTLSTTEINHYTDSLLQSIDNFKQQISLTNSTETDCTGFIQNPSFETGISGWTIEDNTVATAKSTTSLYYRGVGSDGAYLLNNLNASDSTGVAISQTVEGLVPGTYRLTAMVGSSEGNTITMFANDSKVTVNAHSFGKYYLTEAAIDSITVGEDGTLNLGIEAGKWYKADDFRLSLVEENIADGIESVKGEGNSASVIVVPVAGGISITTLSATPIAIHNTAGLLVWNKAVRGTVTVSLPSGIYIVAGKKVAVY